MKFKDFDFNLPKKLIAQEPKKPRDHSRLLILNIKHGMKKDSKCPIGHLESGTMQHKHFYDIIDYLHEGDVLVMNNSKVFPARLIGRRKETGGKLEVFLLRNLTPRLPSPAAQANGGQASPPPRVLYVGGQAREGSPRGGERVERTEGEVWQCLIGGRRARPGLVIEFDQGLTGELRKDNKDSTWEVEFNLNYDEMMKVVGKIGQVPLPPYIKRDDRRQTTDDSKSYQTVYADDKKIGSVAAPTAGFHFTPRLLRKLQEKGVQIEYITLHVGLGTFAPVKTDDISKHKMHAEYVEIEKDVMNRLAEAKKAGKRIVAVGTTSVRTLEAFSEDIRNSKFEIRNFFGWVNIFIYPGYEFKVVDGLITNFHLPKSTLLMLVSAFAGREEVLIAYKEAIERHYRFYSYGDVMLIY